MKKRIIAISLLLLVAIGSGSMWHRVTAGFGLNKIQFDLPTNPDWDFHLSKTSFGQVQDILDQEFTYLDKGRQSYVFESADGNYVIKFFRYHLVRPRLRHYFLQLFKQFREYGSYRILGKRHQFEGWMDSYSLAFRELKEETGILYMHLTNTTSRHNKQITIRDRLNRKYTLDADKVGFLIQKKVDLLYDRVLELTKAKDFDNLARVMKAYLSTVASRYQKGIKNKDHAWTHNYGVYGFDEVYEIDVGRYCPKKIDKNYSHFQTTLIRFTLPIQEYLKANVPEFMETFDHLLIEEAKSYFTEE